jgi:hypothetical protein
MVEALSVTVGRVSSVARADVLDPRGCLGACGISQPQHANLTIADPREGGPRHLRPVECPISPRKGQRFCPGPAGRGDSRLPFQRSRRLEVPAAARGTVAVCSLRRVVPRCDSHPVFPPNRASRRVVPPIRSARNGLSPHARQRKASKMSIAPPELAFCVRSGGRSRDD